VSGVTHATPPFTFSQATFKAQLDLLTLQTDQNTAAIAMANAWRVAIDASIPLSTLPGDFVNPGGAPNLIWSVVNSSVIDTSSKDAAEAQLVTDLTNAPLVSDVNNSLFPKAMRDSFLNLTCSIIGLDQSAPTPLPLSILGAALI
jgi:hypothetical protein